jgi:hypothetical protein
VVARHTEIAFGKLPCDMQREMKELLGSKFALDNTLSISPDEKNCLPYDMQREMKE